jgi:hypothetical protein
VRAVVLLITGSKKAYSSTLVALVAGTVVNGIHLIASRQLRSSSMPVDMVFYVNVLTLIVFLLFRIPPIWQAINFERPSKGEKFNQQALAIVLVSTGILTLTIQFLMAPTHTIGQVNYADVWHLTLTMLGAAQIVSGVFMALRGTRPDPKLEVQPETVQG